MNTHHPRHPEDDGHDLLIALEEAVVQTVLEHRPASMKETAKIIVELIVKMEECYSQQ